MTSIPQFLVVFVLLYLPAGAITNAIAFAAGVVDFDFAPSFVAAAIIRVVVAIWVARAP